MQRFIQRGGVWVLSQIVLLGSIVGAGLMWPGEWGVSGWFFPLVGCLLMVGGFFLVGGLVSLGRFLTIFPEPLQETDLVQSGVYQLVRHPLYTSVVFCALAWSLWWNSVPALCCWAVTVVFMDAKARHEEIRLRQRFAHYPEYAARVKRLIPWIY